MTFIDCMWVVLLRPDPLLLCASTSFFVDNSSPTQCSFLLLNVVLSFVVSFL